MCQPSLYSSLLFLITNRSNLHTDRRSPTKWKDPHCNIVGRIPLGYLCQCRAGSRCFWGTAAPFSPLGSDTLPGQAGRSCEGNVCSQLFPALHNSPCYKTQLLLFWHCTQLSAPEFLVSSPGCVDLPSFPGQHCLQYRALAHPGPL